MKDWLDPKIVPDTRLDIKQVGMPEETRELLRELMAQNRMILEVNCEAMRLLGRPQIVIGG